MRAAAQQIIQADAAPRRRLIRALGLHMPDLRVEIPDAPTPVIVHRFRNFGESVYGAFRASYSISIAEIDASTTMFHVRNVKRRSIRAVSKEILRLAEQHKFAASVVVVE